MARTIPYVFYRYTIKVAEQALDSVGQHQFLQEYQGRKFPHGRIRNDRPRPEALIMRPLSFGHSNSEMYLTWLVGIQASVRLQSEYNSSTMELVQQLVDDTNIKHAPVYALPSRGIMAIEDRSGDECISARQAVAAFRTIVHTAHDAEGSFEVRHGDPTDIRRWLDEWELTEYRYIISPLNPLSAGPLAEKRSEAMKAENVARDSGKLEPPEGQSLHINGGMMEGANELTEAGYGQRGFRGRTPDGHIAHVLKPRFHDDHHKNLAEQEKPQFVRVLFERDDASHSLGNQIIDALKRFYPE